MLAAPSVMTTAAMFVPTSRCRPAGVTIEITAPASLMSTAADAAEILNTPATALTYGPSVC